MIHGRFSPSLNVSRADAEAIVDAVLAVPDPEVARLETELAAVEEFIKNWRDTMTTRGTSAYSELDHLLDEYRLHMNTGTPLNEEIKGVV